VIWPAKFNTIFMERQLRRRRRPALSCFECRRRKIKCDRNDPCAHCVSTRTQCNYKVCSNEPVIQQQPQQASSWNSTSRPLAYATSLLDQPQYISTNRPITEHDNHPSTPRVVAAAGLNDTPNNFGRNHNAEPDFQHLLQRIQMLEESSASGPTPGLAESCRDILARQCGLQDSQIFLNKTRIIKWSHWLGTGQEVQFALMHAP
jgi:hypothetical protein